MFTEHIIIQQHYPMPWTHNAAANTVMDASGAEVPVQTVLAWITAATEEQAAIEYAAHMPADYQYGLPSWINQHLYGRLIMMLDIDDRPIRRSEDIEYMIVTGRLLKRFIIELRDRAIAHPGIGLAELAQEVEVALRAAAQRHREAPQRQIQKEAEEGESEMNKEKDDTEVEKRPK